MSEAGKFPYKNLGESLKRMREKSQESLAEVSGAVEIDIDALTRIERGSDRPAEEILLLLISYFGLAEDEALKLWELAHYDKRQNPMLGSVGNYDKVSLQVMPGDTRIVYTDMVHTVSNDYGVVINFLQGNGPNGQPLIVSRVGMSHEHAKSLLEIMKKTLEISQPKSLPAPDASRDKRSRN